MKADPGNSLAARFRPGQWTPLLLAGAFVVVFWVVVVGPVEHSVFGRVPILDEVYYLDRAAEIAAGEPVPSEPFFMSPLYPYLIAAAGAGDGVPVDRVYDSAGLRGLRLLQICFWLGTLGLIRLLSGCVVPDDWRGWRRNVGLWLPVVLYGLYRPAAVYAMAVLLASALVFLVTLAVYLLLRLSRFRCSAGCVFWLGVVLGLAGLLRGTAVLLLPVAAVVLWRGRSAGRLGLRLGLLLCGVAVVMAPPMVHNSRLAGRLVGPTLNGGVNLFIGNGPAANGFYVAAVPGDWRRDPAGRAYLAERLGRRDVPLAEADHIWMSEAWREIRRAPGRFLGLLARKVWLQLQGWEIDQLTPLAGWAVAVPALRGLVVPYAGLVVLGLMGLLAWRESRPVALLGVVLAVLLLGQSLFFVVSRYRQILVPIWAVLAGTGAVRLFSRGRPSWWVVGLALAITVPWGLSGVRTSWVALAQANEALRWSYISQADGSAVAGRKAEALYRQSLVSEPTRPASWLGLATVLGTSGRLTEQAAVLDDGIRKVADPLPLQKMLLANQLGQGQTAAALKLAPLILQAAPEDADTLHNYSVLLASTDQPEAALTAARKLRRLHPADPRGYVDEGVLLARAGHRQAAREVFQAGLRACPGQSDLVHNLSLLDR